MKKKPVKLTAEQQDEVALRLRQLTEQDEMRLPDSLRSANLLAKLQEQPSFVRIDSDPAPRRRSVYVITTCAAALLLVVGISRLTPWLALNNGHDFTAVGGMSSSMASAALQMSEGGISNYQEIISALQYLASAGTNSGAPMLAASPHMDAADDTASESIETGGGETEKMSSSHSEKAAPGSISNQDSGESNVGKTALRSSETAAPADEPDIQPKEETEIDEAAVSSGEDALSSPSNDLPADVEEDTILEDFTPYVSFSNTITSTENKTYWLDQQSNILRQLENQTLESTAEALLPETVSVDRMESWGNLVACIDPYQFSYYEDGSLSSSGEPGITVLLYRTGEDSMQLEDVMSISGVYEACYLSSDGMLYLVSNQQVNADAAAIKEVLDSMLSGEELELNSGLSNMLPVVYHKYLEDSPFLLPSEQISLIDTPVELNYMNVMSIDLAKDGVCTFWAFLGRKGSLSFHNNTISMVASDGEGGNQVVSIDFSNDRVSYRLSKSMTAAADTAASKSQSTDGYYPPPA